MALVYGRKREEQEMAMTSRIDAAELTRRLNDPREQKMGYPCIDDLEECIDLTATDVLDGWRDIRACEAELFADAFANAFRVLVLAEGQRVFRRTGAEDGRWVWKHTGRIVYWTVASHAEDGLPHPEEDPVNEEIHRDGYGRWFATAAAASDRARELLAVAGEHARRTRVFVRGIELAASQEADDVESSEELARGERVSRGR